MPCRPTIEFGENASRIFVFEEVYPFRAAQEQAEKKKLNAFGMLAKWNPLNRPREDGVTLSRQELRLEPFWHVVAQRRVDYTCQLNYPVSVNNPFAQAVAIQGHRFEVARQGDRGRIDIAVVEQCHRKIGFAAFIDGMRRDLKPSLFENYLAKYKLHEVEQVDRPEAVDPTLPLAAAMQTALARMNGEAINAYDIQADDIVFERTHLYLRPVYAFEFIWTGAGKSGVIEVDGLTGEIVENGRWFKDKMSQLLSRDMMFELGAEVAGSLVPGGGVAVKVLGRLSEPPA